MGDYITSLLALHKHCKNIIAMSHLLLKEFKGIRTPKSSDITLLFLFVKW